MSLKVYLNLCVIDAGGDSTCGSAEKNSQIFKCKLSASCETFNLDAVAWHIEILSAVLITVQKNKITVPLLLMRSPTINNDQREAIFI